MNFSGPRFVPTHPNIVELDRIGDEIAELSAHLDAATARLLDLIREFDARGGWNNGFLSCAHWLCYRVGVAMRAARERVRVARALGTLPQLAQALARGELSYSKVRALTRIATPETEERLLKVGLAGTAEHVERIVRGWRRVDRKVELEDTARRHKNRALHVYHDDEGMVIIRARLEPQAGAVFIQAIAAAREALHQPAQANNAPHGPAGPRYQDGSPEAPTIEQQEADALALVAETALHHGIDPGAPRERYQVVVHVDAAVLADADAPGQSVVEDGAYIPAETSQRLACDASRVLMRHDADGRITEVGARTRTIPPALRRALEHRDQGCRFPGCGRRFGQGHRRCRTLRCCVVGTTARFMKKGFRSSDRRTANCAFDGPTEASSLKSRRRCRYRAIPRRCFANETSPMVFTSTHEHRSRAGSESGWTLATPLTCYTRWPPVSGRVLIIARRGASKRSSRHRPRNIAGTALAATAVRHAAPARPHPVDARAAISYKTIVGDHLFIVSRQQLDLYRYLSREFCAESDVAVVLDRRYGERRTQGERRGTPRGDRRQTDRRGEKQIGSQINTLGYAFVRLA